jgi:addiction module HigA family antidote
MRGENMIPKNRPPTTPGEILKEEFMVPAKMTQEELAKRLDVSVQTVNLLVNGKRAVTAETAWKLSRAFETTPELWMNLQTACDLYAARPKAAHAR